MWDIKLKATKKQKKQRFMDTYNSLVVSRGKRGRGKVDKGKKEDLMKGARRFWELELVMGCSL